MNRFKNYGLWVAIFSFIPLLTEALADYDILIKLPGNYEKLVTALLSIFVLAGIISNPKEGKWFSDEK